MGSVLDTKMLFRNRTGLKIHKIPQLSNRDVGVLEKHLQVFRFGVVKENLDEMRISLGQEPADKTIKAGPLFF